MKSEMWTVRIATDGKVFLESEDFTNDIRLYINGKFQSKDAETLYASNLARKLNGTSNDSVDKSA
jgi:hypothetical protein